MCHAAPLAAFPAEGPSERIDDDVAAWAFGEEGAVARLAVLPDIYGCTPFYRGFASHLATQNARVFLVDPFEGLGELPEATREAAFARRHRLRDRAFVDRIENFARQRALTGVVGFCLGGLYVFELARRELPAKLVGFYGFPQGLENADPLPRPLDYLDGLSTPHTALFGGADPSIGPDVLSALRPIAARTASFDLHVFEGAGHGFLTELDSADPSCRDAAEAALAVCENALGLGAGRRLQA